MPSACSDTKHAIDTKERVLAQNHLMVCLLGMGPMMQCTWIAIAGIGQADFWHSGLVQKVVSLHARLSLRLGLFCSYTCLLSISFCPTAGGGFLLHWCRVFPSLPGVLKRGILSSLLRLWVQFLSTSQASTDHLPTSTWTIDHTQGADVS